MVTFDREKVKQHIRKINNDLCANYKPLYRGTQKRKCMYSVAKFAKDIGMNKRTLNSLIYTPNNPSLNSCYTVAKGMGCKVDDLLIYSRWGD